MNSRTIVRELVEEIEIGRLDEPEMKGICAEALKTLSSDEIIRSTFLKTLQVISPLLENPPLLNDSQKKKIKDSNDDLTRLRELTFAASDLCASLEMKYFECVCMSLS